MCLDPINGARRVPPRGLAHTERRIQGLILSVIGRKGAQHAWLSEMPSYQVTLLVWTSLQISVILGEYTTVATFELMLRLAENGL